jgi:hypothetical protein
MLGDRSVRRLLGPILSVVLWMGSCTEIADPQKTSTMPSPSEARPGAGVGGSSGSGARSAAASGGGGRAGNSAGASGSGGATQVGVTGGGAAGEPQAAVDGIAMVGAACAPEAEGTKACGERESTITLQCTNGRWSAGPECSVNQRCDSKPGDMQGTCLPMLSLCAGKKAGDPVCDGYTRRRCGADLLRFDEFACPEHSHCDGTSVVKCVCDLHYKDDGTGVCTSNIVCPMNACLPGGECVVGAADYSCECGADYEGTGTKSCAVTGRCAEPNVCVAEYMCRNKDMTYVCRGQFADWPMPSRAVGAKAQPNYMATTDSVLDTVTGLSWQRTIPETITGCTTTCTWERAKSYCDSLELEGTRDWRLPTRIELVSILDDDKVMPSIDDEVFPNTPPEVFWTASAFAGEASQAWTVSFGVFQSIAQPKNGGARVRCVREWER